MNEKTKAALLMLLYCIAAASNVIFLSQILKSFNPQSLLFFRWLIVLVILVPIVIKKEGINFPTGKNLILLIIMGITSVVLGNLFAFKAYETTSTINIGFIGALATSITAILSGIFLKEKFTLYKVIGVLLAFIGVIVTLVGSDMNILLDFNLKKGDIFIFLSTFVNCVYSILGKKVSHSGSPTSIVMYSTLFGWLCFIPIGISDVHIPNDISIKLVLFVLYTSIVATLLTRWIFMKSIKYLTASEAAIMTNNQPILTALFSFLFLGVSIGYQHFIGWLIITLGVLFFYKIIKLPIKNKKNVTN
ncbi:DMT family transporter [Sphingobacterium sp. Mn56C]|uniref:DMT family transporter n=1 Tax=Sphingobacterium sp. Mn56C TaxID=3395261 RepID=UPI003BC65D5D